MKSLFGILLIWTQLSSAAPVMRCYDLFSQVQLTQESSRNDIAKYYSKFLDELNQKGNASLFNANLSAVITPESKFSLSSLRDYWRARHVKKILLEIHEHNQNLDPSIERDIYFIDKIATKLEKLSFLMIRPSEQLSLQDRIIFKQTQHSLLSKGLSGFLFHDLPVQPSLMAKIKKAIFTPFKDIYFRWIYALAYMPKLNGSTLPYELAEKILWDGIDSHREELAPYLKTTYQKSFFNVFSSAYNWILVGTLTVGTYNLTTDLYYNVYLRGQQQAVELLTPTLEKSNKLAETDFREYSLQRDIENFKKQFELKYQRQPSPQELAYIESLIRAKHQ